MLEMCVQTQYLPSNLIFLIIFRHKYLSVSEYYELKNTGPQQAIPKIVYLIFAQFYSILAKKFEIVFKN